MLWPVALFLAGTASAQNYSQTDFSPGLPPVQVDASATATTDYRFRGLSLSDGKPALQGQLMLSLAEGWFAGLWASTLKDHNRADAEANITIGWSGPLDWVDLSAGATYYAYVGGDGSAWELFGQIAVPFGPLRGAVGLNLAPSQGNIGGSNRYVYATLNAAIPGTPVTLRAAAGDEKGNLVAGDSHGYPGRVHKRDWRLGADYSFRHVVVGLAYVGNDLPSGLVNSPRIRRKSQDSVILSVTLGF